MSNSSNGDNSSVTDNDLKSNLINNENIENTEGQELPKEEEIIIQYKDIPHDLNNITLKSRFTYKKMLELLENKKDNALTLEEFNDPKKAKIFREKLKRKLIQYYCMSNVNKNKFVAPSELTMKKLKQFKKWQFFQIFQEDGIKTYLNEVLPDYRLVQNTRELIRANLNLYTKLKIKRTNDSVILPHIESKNIENKSIENKEENNIKYIELVNNEKTQSYLSSNEKNNYKRTLQKNKSSDEFNINSSISKIMNNQNPKRSYFKNKQSNFFNNNQSMSLINLIDKSKNLSYNKSSTNPIKSFEESTFCYSKIKSPESANKSITTSPYGGGIFHVNSLLRNKSMNDLLDNPSQNKILQKLNEYQSKRSKIINNKDYLKHIGKTFITLNRHLTNYDYNVF